MMKHLGVIGLGSIGMRHAINLLDMGHHVYGYDPNNEACDKFLRLSDLHGDRVTLWTNPLQDSYNTIRLCDAVVICTLTSTHYDYIMECLTYQLPTFVEKPIAATGREYNELRGYKAIESVSVGYNLRFHSCVKKAKELLPLLGKPIWASFICSQYSEKSEYLREGVILNWSHEIDLALYLLGSAEVITSATHFNNKKDDMTNIILVHERGCSSFIHLDYLTDPQYRGFTIIGEEGRISANLVTRVLKTTLNSGSSTFVGADSFDDNYIEEIKAFLDKDKSICATGTDGLNALDICLKVRKAAGL